MTVGDADGDTDGDTESDAVGALALGELPEFPEPQAARKATAQTAMNVLRILISPEYATPSLLNENVDLLFHNRVVRIISRH